MAKFVFAMNLSLDGYVDHDRFAPDPVLFRHWIDVVRESSASLYGRRIYDLMRYWDKDHPAWSEDERAFATVWRGQPKWVVSRGPASVGPDATQVAGDVEAQIRALKRRLDGEVDVSGPDLARSLGNWGLIDEYRLYYHPVVLGSGKPFFEGHRPALRLVSTDRIGESAVRLTCIPA